jgi:hypothetical protein
VFVVKIPAGQWFLYVVEGQGDISMAEALFAGIFIVWPQRDEVFTLEHIFLPVN